MQISLAIFSASRQARCRAFHLLVVLGVILSAGCRKGVPESGDVMLPVVADAGGAAGRLWKTAIIIDAASTDSAREIELAFWDRDGLAHRSSITLAPRGGVRIEDLFAYLRSNAQPPLPEGALIGPMDVHAAKGALPPVRVEIYSVDPVSGGRVGQGYFSGMVQRASESKSHTLSIAGLPVRPEFRDNLGIVNPGDKSIEVEVHLHDLESGGAVGDPIRIKIEPHRLQTLSDVARALHAPAEAKSLAARIRPTDDRSDFLAYGSVVDSRTEGPVFIAATAVN